MTVGYLLTCWGCLTRGEIRVDPPTAYGLRRVINKFLDLLIKIVQ